MAIRVEYRGPKTEAGNHTTEWYHKCKFMVPTPRVGDIHSLVPTTWLRPNRDLGSAPGRPGACNQAKPFLSRMLSFFKFFPFLPLFSRPLQKSKSGKFGSPPFAVWEDLKCPEHKAREDVPLRKYLRGSNMPWVRKTIGSNIPRTQGPTLI